MVFLRQYIIHRVFMTFDKSQMPTPKLMSSRHISAMLALYKKSTFCNGDIIVHKSVSIDTGVLTLLLVSYPH